MNRNNSGFTLIELVIVMGIMLLLFGFLSTNLINNQRIASVNSVRDSLISDMDSQQTKAMQGAGGASGTNFGVYFLSDRYILFKGNSYSSSDPSNFTVTLDSGIAFSSLGFSNSTILFASGSGEIIGYQNGQNYINIKDNKGTKIKTILLNKYGVVTQD